MNKRLKVLTFVGTRPEVIKMSEIIKKFDLYFDHILVHTGQNYNYELNQIFFEDLELRSPDHYLNVCGDNLGDTIGNVISKSWNILNTVKPDAVVVLGDTNSCLSVLSAKRLKIPVFHLEAGNRCFDENLPEEINRRIVDITSDVNLCYSEHARRYLNKMGCDPARTFCIGSPMPEVLKVHSEKINSSTVLTELGLKKNSYILLSAHREENIDLECNFLSMIQSINSLATTYNMPILYSMHPRSEKYIKQRNIKFNNLIKAHKPFGFTDYINLQKNAFCVVSDSGTLAEEASLLGFPAVSLRTSTERPEVIDAGIFTLGMLNAERLKQAVAIEVALHETSGPNKVLDYRDNIVSDKVVKIVQGYTDYINLMVWRK